MPNGSIPALTVTVGDAATVNVASYFTDPDGDALTYAVATLDTTSVSASVAGSVVTVSAIAAGTATVSVTATDPEGLSAQHSFEVTVPNRAPVAVGSLPAQTLAVGQTVAVDVSAHFEDPDNDSLTYAAATSDSAVAVATVSDNNVLTVTAHARGTATAIVTATDPGGLTGEQSFDVTVPNRAPVVTDSIQSGTLGVDEIASWSGPELFHDPDGDSLTYAAQSSNSQVARPWVTDDMLLVQGLSPGKATVTFSALDQEGLRARIGFSVTVLGPVAISGTEPLVLLEGAAATVFGSGFSPIASENHVFIGGLQARVTAVTETAVSIEVPLADCLPPRRAELRVAVRRRTDVRVVGVTPRSEEDLAIQQGWYRYTTAGNGCLHLPGNALGGEYLIGVVSVSEDPASLTAVALTGTPGDATVVGAASPRIVVGAGQETRQRTWAVADSEGPSRAANPQSLTPGSIGEWFPAGDTLQMRRTRAHGEIMARNEALIRRLGRANRSALANARRQLQVGDTLPLYADANGTCSKAGQVRAVVRRVGDHFVWLDDLDNPGETFTDAELTAFERLHASYATRVHDDYFGPLSDIDGNGRVLALMTREANRLGIGGWVSSHDFYPREKCGTSNVAEITYLRVPDPDGSYGTAVSKEVLLDYYPSLLAHEVTHIIQLGNGVLNTAVVKTAWELEGGARLAEQLVAYRLFGHGSGRELGYAEFGVGAAWYGVWLEELALFFGWDPRGDGYGRVPGAPEECSWVGRPDEGNSGPCRLDGREVYGVPSVVLRFALDRWGRDYPGGERAMMRRLTQSPTHGFASLVDVSPDKSWPPELILSDFYITLWLDLQGWQAIGMRSWNLQDIFARVPLNARLQPYTSFSPVPHLAGHRVRAGSALYLHWRPIGALSPISIKVTAPDGPAIPDHIAVWALRVR